MTATSTPASTADRFRAMSARFAEVVDGVPPGAWSNPAPCEGWVARDIVAHMVGWMPGLLQAGAGVDLPPMPSVADDPAAAWAALTNGIQALLDDPASAAREFHHPQAGDHSLEAAISMFIIGDLFIHIWDLARATGQDETLDPVEVHHMRLGMEPIAEHLAASGHYAPVVVVPDDADEQTRLLALVGRVA